MSRYKLIIGLVVSVIILLAGIVLYSFLKPSDPAAQTARSLQEQQAENFIQQNENKPVIQTEEDLLRDTVQQ